MIIRRAPRGFSADDRLRLCFSSCFLSALSLSCAALADPKAPRLFQLSLEEGRATIAREAQ